jgi:hypothetical protein
MIPSQKGSTVVGRHQNWISSRAVSRVIFSRLHTQFTRFLSISLIYRRYSCICAHKMFNRRPPYKRDSSAIDRSNTPRRIGRLNREEWNNRRPPPYDPYERNSANDRSNPPRRIGRLNREEWNELWEVLVDCWSANPADRPTASELETRLCRIFQNELPQSAANQLSNASSQVCPFLLYISMPGTTIMIL